MAIYTTPNGAGKYWDDRARYDVIEYITNPAKIKHHYCRILGFSSPNKGNELLPEDCARVMTDTAKKFDKEGGVKLRHHIISFALDELLDPQIAAEIAYRVSLFFYGTYETVYAVHEDSACLNIHIVTNSVSYVDGNKFGGTKSDLRDIMKHLKWVLRDYGLKIHYVPNTAN